MILSFPLPDLHRKRRQVCKIRSRSVSEFDVSGLKGYRQTPSEYGDGFRRTVRARRSEKSDDKTAGIENFTLEAATEGSKKYPREVLRRETSSTGGGIGAGSNNDFSVLSLASTRRDFDKLWDVFTDVALNPTFARARCRARPRPDFDRLARTGNEQRQFSRMLLQDRIIYANHPYANDVNGTITIVTSFKPTDLKAYHKKTDGNIASSARHRRRH